MKPKKISRTQDLKQTMSHSNSKDIQNHMMVEIEYSMSERYTDLL